MRDGLTDCSSDFCRAASSAIARLTSWPLPELTDASDTVRDIASDGLSSTGWICGVASLSSAALMAGGVGAARVPASDGKLEHTAGGIARPATDLFRFGSDLPAHHRSHPRYQHGRGRRDCAASWGIRRILDRLQLPAYALRRREVLLCCCASCRRTAWDWRHRGSGAGRKVLHSALPPRARRSWAVALPRPG